MGEVTSNRKTSYFTCVNNIFIIIYHNLSLEQSKNYIYVYNLDITNKYEIIHFILFLLF